ncbi:unnamed protein product [Candidula unifasciata]|uniref:Osteopetrosis-associated transmembrane protein 1 n=1 Tax=Candidula unifasciata TaxID=100452 RepID=A0A8S3ZG03_9EUPU|nr:unnamed protein product [Candidula unifasciata]
MAIFGSRPARTQSQTLLSIKLPVTFTVLLFVWSLTTFQCGSCSQSSEDLDYDEDLSVGSTDTNVSNPCELVYKEYLNVIDNFTHCELQHARPFQLCLSCAEQFEQTKAMFWNLTEEPKHVECKNKYLQSDKVQIIPTMQSNMEDIWNKAHCQNCYMYKPDGLGAGTIVNRTDVARFIELYQNLTDCLNATKDMSAPEHNFGNSSSKCQTCNASYTLLTAHYNSMYSTYSGDVCMDLVDRMNYTRKLWTLHFRCTHREGDHDLLPVVAISCIVACTPILFYVSLRVTSKVGRKKIFKQKRLGTSLGTSSDSGDHSQGAGGDTAASRRRHTTTD